MIKILGLNGAVVLAELINQYNYCKRHNQLGEDGMFYVVMDDIEDNTGLTSQQRKEAMQKLIDLKVLSKCLLGLSWKKYFRFYKKTLWRILQSNIEI